MPRDRAPDLPLADPAALGPLLERLADVRPVRDDETFPLGTLRTGGRVDLCKQGLGPAGATRLLPAALASPHAEHLLLGTNSIGDEGAQALARALAERPGHGLHTLYLGCNRIGPDGTAALADALTGDTSVRALWLKRNPLTASGTETLAGLLRRNTTLRTLDLVNTGIGADGVRLLLDALLDRPAPLERLFLGGNGLAADAAPLLAALIREAGVRELYLLGQPPRGRGRRRPGRRRGHRRFPVPGPARPRRQRHRAARRPRPRRRPRRHRSPRPRPPHVGTQPRRTPNDTGDSGARALAAALPGSPLRRLELRHTGLTGRGAKVLLAAVPEHSSLEYVGLGPGLPRKVKRSFAQRLRPARAAHPDLRAIGSVYR